MAGSRYTPVAIIGAGFSGTLVAAHLARKAISCVVVESRERSGLGTAYSTNDPAHLLNVRAQGMSAWHDRPDDFADYWKAQGGSATDFAPRLAYGRYLQHVLAETTGTGFAEFVNGIATTANRREQGWTIGLSDGSPIECKHLILATGNEAPALPEWAREIESHVVPNPWSNDAREVIASAASTARDILVVGTGLTMIDVVLSLDAASFSGQVVAVSRRGLLPRSHAAFTPAPIAGEHLQPTRLVDLWRFVRNRAAEVGWLAAVDSLRPHSQLLWQQLSVADKDRFLRHARPWWDVHRHRIAPIVAKRVNGLIDRGQLKVIAGRITGAAQDGGRAAVRIRERSGEVEATNPFDVVFNCTGPLGTAPDTQNPLLQQLLGDNQIVPDELGIGLKVDGNSRVNGHVDLWAVGPQTKGQFWEITAVPDIRVQASQIATSIASCLEEGS